MSKSFDQRGQSRQQSSRGFAGFEPKKSHGKRSQGASPARLAALDVVKTLREREAFAQEVIDKRIDGSDMSPEDRAFATKLVLGVVSARGTLDDVLNRCMRTPGDVTADVRDALQISAYEIVFLGKSPHAAVDQGVELVRGVAPRAGGVANAVLRKVVAASKEFPFGDPKSDLEAFARLHAFPAWLTAKVLKDLGPEYATPYFVASNEPAPLFVAVNAAKSSDAAALDILEAAHGEPIQGLAGDVKPAGCYKLQSGKVLLDGRVSRMIANGELLVSDAASQAVAQLVLPEGKPNSFLEIGAGRGTKTILLQSAAVRAWGSQIEDYVTLDNHSFKTKLLRKRAQDYGVDVTNALTGDATMLDESIGDKKFDAVFIDAPCTGLGTLRRHPEIRWRLRPETIGEYAALGLSMLKSAASHLNVGGTLAYATCTITREENVGVVKAFLESPEGADFKLAPIAGRSSFASALEPGGSDAHFAVKMVKVK